MSGGTPAFTTAEMGICPASHSSLVADSNGQFQGRFLRVAQ